MTSDSALVELAAVAADIASCSSPRVVAAIALPAADPPQYLLRILTMVGIYGMLATGLNIVVGRAGLLDLGYVAFFGLGAYTYAMVASDHFDIHFPFIAALALSTAVAAVAGVLLGIPVLRLTRRLSGHRHTWLR